MNIITSVKNIIFDFGGVILNIDYKLTETAFAKLGLADFDKIYSQATQKELFDTFEKGLITPSDFRKEIRRFINTTATDSEIDKAWNAMLLDLPVERIRLLDKLKAKYRTFLLSNTNQIHCDVFSEYIQKRFKRDFFSDVFEKSYFSHKVNMRKPDEEIFELVLKENNLKKEETLFIDDSIQHIESARKIGLHTRFLERGETILDLFM